MIRTSDTQDDNHIVLLNTLALSGGAVTTTVPVPRIKHTTCVYYAAAEGGASRIQSSSEPVENKGYLSVYRKKSPPWVLAHRE